MPTLVHSVRERNGNWVLDNAKIGHLQTLLDDPYANLSLTTNLKHFPMHGDLVKELFPPFCLSTVVYG